MTEEINDIETKKLSLWDNTRLTSYKTCPRQYLYRHVLHWTPEHKSPALIFGSGWHAALEVIWAGYATSDADLPDLIAKAYEAFCKTWVEMGLPAPEELTPDEIEHFLPRTPMIAQEMLYEYFEARKHIFRDPTFKLIDIERPFAVPLDPDNDSRWYVGRLDTTMSFRGQTIVVEHKTTTSYAKNGGFRSDFVDSFSPASQIDGYLYASKILYGDKVAGVWVDAALVHKSVHTAFKFIPVDRQFAQLDAFLWEVHFWIDNIQGNLAVLNERSGGDYLAAFPKNTGSCQNYGGCPYRDICRMSPNPMKLNEIPMGFEVKKWEPFDELKLGKLGFSIDSLA